MFRESHALQKSQFIEFHNVRGCNPKGEQIKIGRSGRMNLPL